VYALLKPLVFRIDPERAHGLTMWLLDAAASNALGRALLRSMFHTGGRELQRRVMGLDFRNGIGLAAGFDKDAKHIQGMACLGFGFIEVGTVTPLPQDGNPKPRLFRLPADKALINRMGFNNAGLDALVARLRRARERGLPEGLVIGGNIGKNKNTPNEAATDDYLCCFEALFPWVDYFVVNVSSPNTPNLRALQEKEPLRQLLSQLQAQNKAQNAPKPILLKIAPDLNEGQLADIAEIVLETGLAGVVATNTTIRREGLRTAKESLQKIGVGGLSGVPVQTASTEIIRSLREKIGSDRVIIGVGGVDSAASAQEKLLAGADLVQVYSGLVYEGPGLVRRILRSFLG
jgi:dihydroorotate dehydrogenase